MKYNLKTKMNNIVQFGRLISKLLRVFVIFLSMIVVIFYRDDGAFIFEWLSVNLTNFVSSLSGLPLPGAQNP